MRVADLMTSTVAECAPEESLRVAAKRMCDHRCGCLPVTVSDGEQKRLVGIITDRDITCRAVAEGLDAERTEVSRCMSFPVHTIHRDADVGQCADHFTSFGVRRLVVIDEENRCLGVISRADFHRYVSESVGGERFATTASTTPSPSAAGSAGASPANSPADPPHADARSEAARNGIDVSPNLDPDRGNPELAL